MQQASEAKFSHMQLDCTTTETEVMFSIATLGRQAAYKLSAESGHMLIYAVIPSPVHQTKDT